MPVVLRILSAIGVVVFGVFAFLQWDDPDSALWIMVYGYAATLSALLFFRRDIFYLAVLGLAAYLAHLAWLAPHYDANWIHSETAREGAGLAICGVWMIFCAWASRHNELR